MRVLGCDHSHGRPADVAGADAADLFDLVWSGHEVDLGLSGDCEIQLSCRVKSEKKEEGEPLIGRIGRTNKTF